MSRDSALIGSENEKHRATTGIWFKWHVNGRASCNDRYCNLKTVQEEFQWWVGVNSLLEKLGLIVH